VICLACRHNVRHTCGVDALQLTDEDREALRELSNCLWVDRQDGICVAQNTSRETAVIALAAIDKLTKGAE
jgi:hypothetical protein